MDIKKLLKTYTNATPSELKEKRKMLVLRANTALRNHEYTTVEICKEEIAAIDYQLKLFKKGAI